MRPVTRYAKERIHQYTPEDQISILQYLLWLDTSLTRRGKKPQMDEELVGITQDIYEGYLRAKHRREKTQYSKGLHVVVQDPHVLEGGASHRKGLGDMSQRER